MIRITYTKEKYFNSVYSNYLLVRGANCHNFRESQTVLTFQHFIFYNRSSLVSHTAKLNFSSPPAYFHALLISYSIFMNTNMLLFLAGFLFHTIDMPLLVRGANYHHFRESQTVLSFQHFIFYNCSSLVQHTAKLKFPPHQLIFMLCSFLILSLWTQIRYYFWQDFCFTLLICRFPGDSPEKGGQQVQGKGKCFSLQSFNCDIKVYVLKVK